MKNIFFISALTTINAMACPDFSGRYETTLEMNIPAIQQIIQNGCESIDITIYNESQTVEYSSYRWILDGNDQAALLDKKLFLSGKLYDDVFHWSLKDKNQNTVIEAWDSLLENGDIERIKLEKLSSGQVITKNSIIKRVSDM